VGDGKLHAFNTANGTELWSSFITGGEDYVLAQPTAPAANSSAVYVAAPPNASLQDRVYGFSVAGSPLWTAIVSGICDKSTPALDASKIYVATTYGVTAINISDGSIAWSSTAGTATTWTVASSAAIYYGTAGTVKALDISDGHLLWTSAALGGTVNDLALSDGKLFARFGSTLRALDASAGTAIWAAAATVTTPPAIANGQVYAGTGNGNLRSFDEATGTELWSTPAGNPVGVTVANGVVFTTWNTRAFDASTGTQLVNLGNALGNSPESPVANGVFFVSNTYNLLAYIP